MLPFCFHPYSDHVVFASDSPFDLEGGTLYIREPIRVIDELDLPDVARAKIDSGNAIRLLKLTAV